jgi:hypothetical protein
VSLQRVYREARRRARFTVAVLLTIVVVAYVGVPHVARIVESMSGYNPGRYEPKDLERGAWLQRAGDSTLFAHLDWQTLVNVALFLLVAVVWLTLVPTRRGRRTPYR